MADETSASSVSSLKFLRDMPSLREHLQWMQDTMDRVNQKLNQSEQRLTEMESRVVTMAENGQTSAEGQRNMEALADASYDEYRGIARCIAELDRAWNELDQLFADIY